MRFQIFVIVLKLLLNSLWNHDFLCFQICGALEAFEEEPFQENEYLQSELGKPSPLPDEVIDENVKLLTNDEDHKDITETTGDSKESAKSQETLHVEKPTIKEAALEPHKLPNSDLMGDSKVITSLDTFAVKDNFSEAELQHGTITSETLPADQHLSVDKLSPEESALVEAKVLPEDFMIKGNSKTKEKSTDIFPIKDNFDDGKLQQGIETRKTFSADQNFSVDMLVLEESLVVEAKVLPQDSTIKGNSKTEEKSTDIFPIKDNFDNAKVHHGTEMPETIPADQNMTIDELTAEESVVAEAKVLLEDFTIKGNSKTEEESTDILPKKDNFEDAKLQQSTGTPETFKAGQNMTIDELTAEESVVAEAKVLLQDFTIKGNSKTDQQSIDVFPIRDNSDDAKLQKGAETRETSAADQNFSVDMLVPEESVVVESKVLPQDFTIKGNSNAEEKPADIFPIKDNFEDAEVLHGTETRETFSADKNLSVDMLIPEESAVVEAKVLPSGFTVYGNPKMEERSIDMELENNNTLDFEPHILDPYVHPLDTLDFLEYKSLQLFQRRFRDTFLLQYIEEDFSFNLNDFGVSEWQHFRHNSQELLIGKRLTDLLIINPNDLAHKAPAIINIGSPITALTTYSFWNFDLYQEEGIILVASIDKILWYRLNPAMQKFHIFGQWDLGGYIKQISYFLKGSESRLAVGFNHTILQIFKFQLNEQQFWMAQELYFEQEFESFLIENTGNEIALILSHEEVVSVYKMNPSYEQDFHLQQSIAAPALAGICTFSIRGAVYLALSGFEAQILIFHQGEFRRFINLSAKFGKVEQFLPISLKNNQDDLMLLVYFQNNTERLIQNLQWNGKSFESGFPVPCHGCAQNSKNLQCLVELQSKIFRSNLLDSCVFSKDNKIYLIIPGFMENSKIFHFHFELLAQNSELMDLLEYFIILNEWFGKQHQILNQVQEFLKTPDDVLIRKALEQETASLDYVEAPEIQLEGDVNEIYLNDHLWSQEDSEINLDSLINLLEDLDKSLLSSRQRRDLNLNPHIKYDALEYDNVWAEELEIENLNGEPFYVNNGILDFAGDIEFEDLNILNQVEHDAHKRQTLEDVVSVQGDLEFDVINGIKWSDFTKNIVLRNQLLELEALKVNGEVVVEEGLSIKSLNTLNFPEDYLVANGPRSSKVTAKKYFINSLSANSVDTDGLINQQNPEDAITLMDPQEWHGLPIFNHLEVSEKLELHGTAHGRNVDRSPFNPTLKESQIIDASCIFNELEVNGPIVLKGDLDEKPLAELLNNIVQRPDNPLENCNINSPKSFEEISFPIDFIVENNAINDIPTEKFITAHTLQHLNVNVLDGYVYFYNLSLKGFYDGVKLEDVQREAIPLDKPLDLGTTQLIFEDHEFQADTLIVLENLNGLAIKNNLQSLHEDLILDSAEFEDLQAKQAEFSADIFGPGTLNNINLENFVNDRSWHEPPIQGNLFLNELIAPQGIQADEVHGINATYLFEFLQGIDDLPEMVLNGQIQVDHITVMGDVQLSKVNGQMFDEDIQMTVIWLNRQNHLANNLTFKNLLNVKGHLRVEGNYQNRNLKDLLNDFAWKDTYASSINITAPKSFLSEVKILKNFYVEAINGQEVKNLAMKTRENIFQGSLKIKGNLITPELEVLGSNSAFNIKEIENLLYYNQTLNCFVLKGFMQFDNPVQLEDLTVMGSYNNYPNLNEFFDNLIDKTQPCELKGNNTFTGRITIEQGLHVHRVNNIDVDELFKNLVFTQGLDGVIISSPIKFLDPIRSTKISVLKSLKAFEINGCSLEEWLHDTLRVDEDKYIPYYLPFSKGTLDGNSLKVHYLNDINLQHIITLHTPQVFTMPIKFSDLLLSGQIKANGSINALDLEEEYKNTLMIYGGQHISTPLIIQSIEVLNDLEILCLVNNNLDLHDLAMLDDYVELQSPLYFRSLYSPQFITKDLVSGINLTKWFSTAMRFQGEAIQYVTGNWKTRLLNMETPPHGRQYDSNGLQALMRNTRDISSNHEELCGFLKDFWRKLKEKTIKLKYIEEDFGFDPLMISSAAKRRKILSTSFGADIILFLNLDCSTYLYKWNFGENKFMPFRSFESGLIDQIIMLPSREAKTFNFITNYQSKEPMNCSVKGLNLWSLRKASVQHEHNFMENVSDLYVSQANKSLIVLLSHNKVMELNLLTNEVKEMWVIPSNSNEDNETPYQFLLKDQDMQDMAVTNGKQTVFLTTQNSLKSKKEVSDRYYSYPLPPWLSITPVPDDLPHSLLIANSTMAQKFAFGDFSPTLQRLILVIIEKLNHQINITQLTIPESDLYDEHLIPDFLYVMDQLQQQNILFATKEQNLNITNITIPENPAHVLAARVIFVIWPKVQELQEIHGFLKDNQAHNHTICKSLTQSLSSLIEQVLEKAYPREIKDDYNEDLLNVVEVIRHQQNSLQELVRALQIQDQQAQHALQTNGELLASASNTKSRFHMNNVENHNDFPKSEILPLVVGAVNNSLRLLAISKAYATPTADHDSSIQLHSEDLKGAPFQIIAANRPRSLIQLRLGSETLLGFIENCCQVQVWKYQGVQGFIKYASFKSETPIEQLHALRVPYGGEEYRQYVLLLLKDEIKFYNIAVEGRMYDPPNLPCP